MTAALPLQITPEQVKKLIDDQQPFVLLDVREQAEYDIAAIAGSQLLPMSEIQTRIGELESLRDQHLVVHCHHGGRSQQVVDWLAAQGYSQVQNMTGGIERWALEVDSSIPRY